MTVKQKVLVLGKPKQQFLKEFNGKFEFIHYEITTLEKVLHDFQTKLADIEAIYAGWSGFHKIGGFRGKLISFAPKNLRIIASCTVGYDHYDSQGMAERGIILTNVPSQIAFEAVADLVLYNTITSFRNFKIFENHFGPDIGHTAIIRTSVVEGEFDQQSGKALIQTTFGDGYADACCGRENLSPRGHNAVIVGFGNIGKLIATRLACIGMNIHYVKRRPLSAEEEKSVGIKMTYHQSLADTADFADLIVIACPGTPATKHMINEDLINKMKKQVRIINIGRGYVIHEEALVNGLKLGKVLFAGLDVFEHEPGVHPELFGREDVVLTPHIGSAITENDKFTAMTSLKNIETVLFGYSRELTRVN